MSKQSDGNNLFISLYNGILIVKQAKMFVFISDAQVDCNMKLFQPLSISYTDYTDWNWNST